MNSRTHIGALCQKLETLASKWPAQSKTTREWLYQQIGTGAGFDMENTEQALSFAQELDAELRARTPEQAAGDDEWSESIFVAIRRVMQDKQPHGEN